MFLAIDIGNTNISIGLFSTKNKKVLQKPLKVWRMLSLKRKTADEYAVSLISMFSYLGFKTEQIKAVATASVVPCLNGTFEELAKKYFKKENFFISKANCGKMTFSYEVGADRIANVIAAKSFYGNGGIVIDFGTATTFDCINLNGTYIGGAISTGPELSAQSLFTHTAQLPKIEIKKPATAIGSKTVECMQSGIYFGYIGTIKEIIARIKKETTVKWIIATGGLSSLVTSEVEEIKAVLPDLTLEGIRIIWEKNNKFL
ncbi:MAG: type III pantothenate kinase [Elusimicrobiota bacterium]|jgi:type III pantothenate kinase|nr:type III pantothenate kinase [Elusimicrobiota bacterium]